MNKRTTLIIWIVVTAIMFTYNLFYGFTSLIITLGYFFYKFTPSSWWDDAKQQ